VSLLRVIDNPNQDIPLLAVLMSPLYGFSADDMARLRLENREESVYLSLLRAAEGDIRCRQVLRELGEYRAVAATMPSDGFLNYLYQKTGFPDLAQAMEDGPQRLENLRLLERYAREYESSGYHGVSGFVRFLDRLKESGSDLQAAELPLQERDAVTVMSIHKSKGLEFPVCIVAGCGRNFVSDQRAEVLLHPELGLGVKLRDQKRSARFTTTAREAIENFQENRAIFQELDYYREHGAILGKHRIFEYLRQRQQLHGLNIVELLAEQRRLRSAIWRINDEIKKGTKPYLQAEREKRRHQKETLLAEVDKLIDAYTNAQTNLRAK
jgi:ATP-dependent helicase/nuclease subunit A